MTVTILKQCPTGGAAVEDASKRRRTHADTQPVCANCSVLAAENAAAAARVAELLETIEHLQQEQMQHMVTSQAAAQPSGAS